MKKLLKYFYTGLISLLPIVITISIFNWILNITIRIFKGTFINKIIRQAFVKLFQYSGYTMDYQLFSSIAATIAILIFICLVGATLRFVFFAKLMKKMDNLFLKMPIFKQVYKTITQIIKLIVSDRSDAYKKVVMVEYPRKGIYSMGFLTNERNKFAEEVTNHEQLCNIFIPTSPNPTSGMFIIVPFDEVKFLNIPVEEAIKLIISGGLVNPDEWEKEVESIEE